MKYVYGPIISRRLGRSLGVDPIPLKTCNWNCIYCQLGRTHSLTNRRRAYTSAIATLREVKAALAASQPGDIDWITIVGSGEPTLHSDIGWLIRQIQRLGTIPVAVITNGATLSDPEVRHDLAPADAVMPTVSAGRADLFRQLHRPHPEINFTTFIRGLVAFRGTYEKRFWPEVMLVQGVNDDAISLEEIAAVMRLIRPDAIHVNLPVRPPAEVDARPPGTAALRRAARILGRNARVLMPLPQSFTLSDGDELVADIVATIQRHPVPESEIVAALDAWDPIRRDAVMAALAASGAVTVIARLGQRFWCAAPAHYGMRPLLSRDERQRQRQRL